MTQWFDVKEGWCFLTDVKVNGKHQVGWQCGNMLVWWVGNPSLGEVAATALRACRPFAEPHVAEFPLKFATRKAARAAVEAANVELQRLRPMEYPLWATLALVRGWTPPEAECRLGDQEDASR